jgi:hypothetical protein
MDFFPNSELNHCEGIQLPNTERDGYNKIWFISKFVGRIFHESLPGARKKSSRSERDAASIGGISAFHEPPVGHPQSAAGAG